MAKPKIMRGAKVRLLRDITTRGGTRFRAGLTMRVTGFEGGLYLRVSVRGRGHSLRLLKKDAPRYVELVSVPEPDKESV